MADSTTDGLTAASALDGTEEFYAVQGAADRKVTGTQIKTLTLTGTALPTGTAVSVEAGGPDTAFATGSSLGFTAGNSGASSGTGGYLFFTGGVGTNGPGGEVRLFSGNSLGNSGGGGFIFLTAGYGNAFGSGGSVAIEAGAGGEFGQGGALNLTAGAGGVTSGNGGNITLTPGTVTSGVVGHVILAGITIVGTNPTTMTFPPASASVGYLNVPQSSKSANYTTLLTDAGKHILHPSADTTARDFTIDSNANVPYILGTVITFVNQNAGGVITIKIASDTMRLAGAGTTGDRFLAANGIATAIKVATTEWLISGTGLT